MANRYGLLPYYEKADLKDLVKEASDEFHKLKKFFDTISNEELYVKRPNVYLFGAQRRGKTWMLHAIMNKIIEMFAEKSLFYITAPHLMRLMLKDDRDEATGESLLNVVTQKKILFLDDLGQEYKPHSGFVENRFEEFLRWRFSHNKITFVSGNATIEHIEQIYGKSFGDFLGGEYITFEVTEDAIDLSKLFLDRKWNKSNDES